MLKDCMKIKSYQNFYILGIINFLHGPVAQPGQSATLITWRSSVQKGKGEVSPFLAIEIPARTTIIIIFLYNLD